MNAEIRQERTGLSGVRASVTSLHLRPIASWRTHVTPVACEKMRWGVPLYMGDKMLAVILPRSISVNPPSFNNILNNSSSPAIPSQERKVASDFTVAGPLFMGKSITFRHILTIPFFPTLPTPYIFLTPKSYFPVSERMEQDSFVEVEEKQSGILRHGY